MGIKYSVEEIEEYIINREMGITERNEKIENIIKNSTRYTNFLIKQRILSRSMRKKPDFILKNQKKIKKSEIYEIVTEYLKSIFEFLYVKNRKFVYTTALFIVVLLISPKIIRELTVKKAMVSESKVSGMNESARTAEAAPGAPLLEAPEIAGQEAIAETSADEEKKIVDTKITKSKIQNEKKKMSKQIKNDVEEKKERQEKYMVQSQKDITKGTTGEIIENSMEKVKEQEVDSKNITNLANSNYDTDRSIERTAIAPSAARTKIQEPITSSFKEETSKLKGMDYTLRSTTDQKADMNVPEKRGIRIEKSFEGAGKNSYAEQIIKEYKRGDIVLKITENIKNDKKLSGKIRVYIKFSRDGKAEEIRIEESSKDEIMDSWILERAKGWRFDMTINQKQLEGAVILEIKFDENGRIDVEIKEVR